MSYHDEHEGEGVNWRWDCDTCNPVTSLPPSVCLSTRGMHSCGLRTAHPGKHECCACEGVSWASAPREHASWCQTIHETGHCTIVGA